MVNDEIEFPEGTSEETIKRAEMEFKKDRLAVAFGWTREELDINLETLKDFFTTNKKLNQ